MNFSSKIYFCQILNCYNIVQVAGFEGGISCIATELDGAPRKLLDVSRLTNMAWTASVPLEEGIRQAYDWYLANQGSVRTA